MKEGGETHILCGLEEPVLCASSVGNGFLSGEGLGSDNEDGSLPITRFQDFGEIGSINVGDEVHLQVPLGVMLECFTGHDGTQVGTTNTNVDNSINFFSSVSLPFT